MRRKLKHRYRELAEAPAGERFARYHRRRGTDEQAWKRILHLLAGAVMVLLGVTLSVPPGVPGFIVTLIGVGMIAARSRAAARALDRAELALRGVMKAARKHLPLASREDR